jgi:hypothetical protein
MHQPQLRRYKSRELIEIIEEGWTEQRELILKSQDAKERYNKKLD